MKKVMLMLAFAGLFSFANAQEVVNGVPMKKHSVATNSFWANWFITVGGNYNAFYGDQQHGLGLSNSPFKDFRRDWGFGIGIGKSFTPGFALRTKFSGVWGKSVVSENCAENKKGMKNYFSVNEQAMFNLSNLIFGYNENRVWNLIPYAGAGIIRNCTSNNYAIDLTAGIMSTWKIAKKVDLFLDATAIMAEAHIDGETGSAAGYNHSYKGYDMIYSLEAGLKFNLGKSNWSKVPDVDALMAMNKEQLDALNASLRDAQAENARLKNLLANQKPAEVKEVVKKELATTAQSVFFNIGKSRIASRKDLVNVNEVAKYAKENGNKIVVTGYADSKTGSKNLNQKLSQKRAEAVANELVKMGVSRDNIVIKAAGGVNDLSPISYNRRATVELQ